MEYEVIVIGGGPAGMSAALNFGRGMMHTLVIDEDKPRNKVTQLSHGYLTQDGISPQKFKQQAIEDVSKYKDVSIVNARVVDIIQIESGFKVSTASKSYTAKQILVATGVREHLPKINNIESFYGKTVFYCPWCDGFEMKHTQLGVFYSDKDVIHIVKLLRNFSKKITVFTNGIETLEPEAIKFLEQHHIVVCSTTIKKLLGEQGQLKGVELEDGSVIKIEGAFTQMGWDTEFNFLNNILLERDEQGKIKSSPYGETNINGLYVTGETKDNFPSQLIDAASNGGNVAKNMMMSLINETYQ